MKKVVLFASILMLMVTSVMAQTPYQKNKTFYPFAASYAAKSAGKLWAAIDGGIRNNNLEFRILGATANNWERKDNIVLYTGVGKRFITVGREELWGKVSVSSLMSKIDIIGVGPQFTFVHNYDKALKLSAGIGTNLQRSDNFKYHNIVGNVGVIVMFMPRAHLPY